MKIAVAQIALGIIAVALSVAAVSYAIAERPNQVLTFPAPGSPPDYTISIAGGSGVPEEGTITVVFPSDTSLPVGFDPSPARGSQGTSALQYTALGFSIALGLVVCSLGVLRLRTAGQQDAVPQ